MWDDIDFGTDIEMEALLEDNLMPATEGYVGKTKECLAIEKQCAILCARYHDAGFIDTATADIHDSREIHNIEELLEDLTGFRQVKIIVMNKNQMNAGTCPGSVVIRNVTSEMPNCPTDHGRRYYDKKHHYFCMIVINAEMFVQMDPDEVTAFILHEVGHNFDHTLSYWLFDCITWIATLPSGPLSILMKAYAPEISWGWHSLFKILEYIPLVPIFKNLRISLIRGFGMLLGPLGAYTSIINVLERIADNPAGAALGASMIHRETFADSYAASMGYGDALIRGLNKMDKENYITKAGPVVEAWTGAGSAAAALVLMFCDPHPENQSSARLILDDMERATHDKTIPPNMRAALAADHKRCKQAYEEFVSADKDSQNAICTRFSRKLKEALFNGKVDFRLLIMRLFNAQSALQQRDSIYNR